MSKRSKRHRRAQRSQQPHPRPAAIFVAEPGYVESAKRMLLEDALVVLFAEMLDDPATVGDLRRLGIHERVCSLMRWVFHQRANPETPSESMVRDELRQTPVGQRPEPFRSAGAPMPKAVTRD